MGRNYIKSLYIIVVYFLHVECSNSLDKRNLEFESYFVDGDCASLTARGEHLKWKILNDERIKFFQLEYEVVDPKMDEIANNFFHISASQYFMCRDSKEEAPYSLIRSIDEDLYIKFIQILVQSLLLSYTSPVYELKKSLECDDLLYDTKSSFGDEKLHRECYIVFRKMIYALSNETLGVKDFGKFMNIGSLGFQESSKRKNNILEYSKTESNKRYKTLFCETVNEVNSSKEKDLSDQEYCKPNIFELSEDSSGKAIYKNKSISSTFDVSNSSCNTKKTVAPALGNKEISFSDLERTSSMSSIRNVHPLVKKVARGEEQQPIKKAKINQIRSYRDDFFDMGLKKIVESKIKPTKITKPQVSGQFFIGRDGFIKLRYMNKNVELNLHNAQITLPSMLRQKISISHNGKKSSRYGDKTK